MTGPEPVTVVLVRHGPVEADGRCSGRRYDPPLHPSAPAAITALAGRLPRPLGPVTCSPVGRARSTAELLGVADPAVDARWAERDFGELEGRRWEDVWAELPPGLADTAQDWAAFTPPGAESYDEVAGRVAAALDEVTSRPAAPPAVVVTHAGPIRLAIAHALGLTAAQALAFDPAPATATWLTRWGDTWTIDRFGA